MNPGEKHGEQYREEGRISESFYFSFDMWMLFVQSPIASVSMKRDPRPLRFELTDWIALLRLRGILLALVGNDA